MDFEGYQELKTYIAGKKTLSFTSFVNHNVANLANWSYKSNISSATALCGFWYENYSRVYLEVTGRKNRTKPKAFNVLIWNDIIARMNRRRNMVDKCSEAAIDAIGEVEASAAAQVTDNKNTNGDDETPEMDGDDSDIDGGDDENPGLNMGEYLAKKLLGTLDAGDKVNLQQKMTQDSSIRAKINNHVIKLLCQDHLTNLEHEILKLLASAIINTIDSSMYTAMKAIFTANQLAFLCEVETPESEEMYGLDFPSVALLNDIVNKSNNLADLSRRISMEKVNLIDKKEMNSDCYRMLGVLGLVVDGIGMPIDDKASEMTFYRRFSVLLDYVFAESDITTADGEIVSQATRMAMEQNDYDITNYFGRKIDLLLKLKDSSIELASNEWKSNNTKSLQLKQQSRNLRSNCAILKRLYIESKTKIDTIMAVDFVGSIGYMYKLQWKHGVFLAKKMDSLFLPSKVDQVRQFKKTMMALFFWKDFLANQAEIMKNTLLATELERMTRSPSPDDATMAAFFNLPPIFFTPKNKRIGKRSIELVD